MGALNGHFQQDGQGVEYDADGLEVASGQWRNGKQHGRGMLNLLRGNRYEGDFVDGKYSGLGAFMWADGSVHEGEFAAGHLNGFCVKWNNKGKMRKCGRWENDKLVEECPVPRSKIPIGSWLAAHGQPRSQR